jgi:hypothetical protein
MITPLTCEDVSIDGTWDRMLTALLADADAARLVDRLAGRFPPWRGRRGRGE